MVNLLFSLLQFTLLFFLSRKLLRTFHLFFRRLTGNQNTATEILTWLFLPGTIIHELSHFLVATILFVPTGRMEFTPIIEEERVKAATIEVAKTDPLRRALIGLGPIIVGLTILFTSLYWYYDKFGAGFELPEAFLLAYIIFQITNTMYLSKEDAEGLFALVASILFIALSATVFLYWRGVEFPIFRPAFDIPSLIPKVFAILLAFDALVLLFLRFLLRMKNFFRG